MNKFDSVSNELSNLNLIRRSGKISRIVGLVIESNGPSASIGEMCTIENNKVKICEAEVVGFSDNKTLLMPYGSLEGIRPGMTVVANGQSLSVDCSEQLLGRVLNGLGEPLDDKGAYVPDEVRSVYAEPPEALKRKRINEEMSTGIRAIDGFLTVGKGQRVGIFAGSGVGKSVTMGMIARNCLAEVNVIALIGERGREVKEFIEKDLGPEGLKRSIVIVATSDQPALVRLKSSLVATTIAEYFRDMGKDVLLMMDSSTRLAMAQREIGLAIGEPPTTKGYPPSVFGFLPKMFERAGTSDKGSITGLYTVLVEGSDMEDPIADSVRSILDGHIVLDRKLANKNHYPAIDVLQSISRCRPDIISKDDVASANRLLKSIAKYREAEDLIQIGAYAQGSDPDIDLAMQVNKEIESLLIQGMDDESNLVELRTKIKELSEVGYASV